MKGFFSKRWSKVGLAFVVFGWGPLLLIILLAAIGLWPDPNPNPIDPACSSSSRRGPQSFVWELGLIKHGARICESVCT